jgi:creatinine amidohydrolase
MATDRIQADWLGNALIRQADVVVWPTITYGYYPAFVHYPGTISLRRSTFVRLACDVLRGILGSGARRVVVANTGISTITALQEAVGSMGGRPKVRLINVYEGPGFRKAVEDLEQQRRGSHADEIETSIMLAIAPERVCMERAVAWDASPLRGVLRPDDPRSPGYSPSGVYGDPTRASEHKGRRLLDAMLGDILEQLDA